MYKYNRVKKGLNHFVKFLETLSFLLNAKLINAYSTQLNVNMSRILCITDVLIVYNMQVVKMYNVKFLIIQRVSQAYN